MWKSKTMHEGRIEDSGGDPNSPASISVNPVRIFTLQRTASYVACLQIPPTFLHRHRGFANSLFDRPCNAHALCKMPYNQCAFNSTCFLVPTHSAIYLATGKVACPAASLASRAPLRPKALLMPSIRCVELMFLTQVIW